MKNKFYKNLGETADELGYPGVGRNNLAELLKNWGLLDNNAELNSDHPAAGHFKTVTKTLPNGWAHNTVLSKPSGRDYIRNRICNDLGLKNDEVVGHIRKIKRKRRAEELRQWSNNIM
ncbi:MAG: hypothetical protein R3275_13350 [Saprospiraceae bacterium]|nr:hypothetical protein [Saprospiraceae bacterium]